MLACSSEVLAFLNVCNARNLGGCSVKEKKGGIFAAHRCLNVSTYTGYG